MIFKLILAGFIIFGSMGLAFLVNPLFMFGIVIGFMVIMFALYPAGQFDILDMDKKDNQKGGRSKTWHMKK